jgi:hypothetical protein
MINVRHNKIAEVKIEVLATHCFNTIELHIWIINPYHVIENWCINLPMYQCFNVLPIEVVLMIVILL